MIGAADTRESLAITSTAADRMLENFMNRYEKGLDRGRSLVALGMSGTTGAGGKDAQPRAAAGTACPTTPLPPGMPSMPPIPMATSIKPSDTSSSTVIKPDPADQIECGRTALKTVSNVAFAEVPARAAARGRWRSISQAGRAGPAIRSSSTSPAAASSSRPRKMG